jgi:hypothetical protein
MNSSFFDIIRNIVDVWFGAKWAIEPTHWSRSSYIVSVHCPLHQYRYTILRQILSWSPHPSLRTSKPPLPPPPKVATNTNNTKGRPIQEEACHPIMEGGDENHHPGGELSGQPPSAGGRGDGGSPDPKRERKISTSSSFYHTNGHGAVANESSPTDSTSITAYPKHVLVPTSDRQSGRLDPHQPASISSEGAASKVSTGSKTVEDSPDTTVNARPFFFDTEDDYREWYNSIGQ